MDKIQKFLNSLEKKERLIFLQVLEDIGRLNLSKYDIKPLKAAKGYYRLRKGNIRIIFLKGKNKGFISSIARRKDAYKAKSHL